MFVKLACTVGWPLASGTIATAPGLPSCPSSELRIISPARSPLRGGATRVRVIGTEVGVGELTPSTTGSAIRVPVPTWQALIAEVLFRHAPPSIDALESRPGGRDRVRF